MTDKMEGVPKSHQRIEEETYKHFSSIDWTNRLLHDPAYRPLRRYVRADTEDGAGYLFARTLNTESTIPYMVYLHRRGLKPPEETPKGIEIKKIPHSVEYTVPEKPDTIHMMRLGLLGLDGHPGIIHGGGACAILDEAMGQCASLNIHIHAGSRQSLFTANLDVNFRRPVPTNGEVIVRSWIGARQGRRWYVYGQIVSKDGTVLTEGQGIWIHTPQRKEIAL